MQIVGHRGARGEAPENTLAGFRHLRQCGIKRVEFDIQVAADGVLVVIHDAELERCTDGSGRVSAHDSLALAQLDALHRSHPHWPGREGVPTLAEVLAELRDFEHLQLEVKARHPADAERVVAVLPQLYERYQLHGRGVCTSFNPLFLQALKDRAAHIPRGLLFEHLDPATALSLAEELGCVQIGPEEKLCTPALVQAAVQRKLSISTWTVNAPERMLALHQLGIESIITDLPSQALRILSKTGS